MPVGPSLLLISKYILYFIERQDGFELYIDLKMRDLLTQFSTEEKEDHLEFIMEMKNRDFLNYTELDISKGSFLLLKSVNSSYPEDGSFVLHQGDFISDKDLTDISSKHAANIPREYLLRPNSFALIHIPFRKKDNNVILTEENGKLFSSSGTIKFQARSTFWKYLFFPKENSQFESLKVIDSTGQITFSEMHLKKDSEDSQVYVTESDVRITLQEISEYQFQLKGTKNGIEQTIIQRLAEPDPQNLSKENGKLYSTIFIYY